MIAALVLLAQVSASADWFEAFRGESFLVDDSSWLARDPALPGDAAPAMRLRHLLFLQKTAGEPPFWWERRSVLMIEMPSGSRYAAEICLKLPREGHAVEPMPHLRLASAGGAMEWWDVSEDPVGAIMETEADPEGPCAGQRTLVRGGGRAFAYSGFDLTRTMRAGLADVRDATFRNEEREELWQLQSRLPREAIRLEWDVPERVSFMAPDLFGARLAWMLPFLGRKSDPTVTRLRLVRDPAPPGDLAAWRAITYLPVVLKTMDPPRFEMEGPP